MVDLRKNGWKDTNFTVAAPKALNKKEMKGMDAISDAIYDPFEYDDAMPFGLDMMASIMGTADDNADEIRPTTVPIAAQMVAANTRKWGQATNRYSASGKQSNKSSPLNNKVSSCTASSTSKRSSDPEIRIRSTRRDRMKGQGLRLLETEDNTVSVADVAMQEEEKKVEDVQEVRIGRRKTRMT